MKTLKILITLCLLSQAVNGQVSINCLPDKGLKFAKTVIKLESEVDFANSDKYQLISYDTIGRVTSIKNGRNESVHYRVYKNGRLNLMISTRKNLPDFYSTEDKDSLIKNAELISDTVVVTKHDKNNEIVELKIDDESTQVFSYINCDEESNTILDSQGDTLQQSKLIFKNGVIVKSIWTPFQPIKSNVITVYYDYEFNKQGHWIKRKYKGRKGPIIEERQLTYY